MYFIDDHHDDVTMTSMIMKLIMVWMIMMMWMFMMMMMMMMTMMIIHDLQVLLLTSYEFFNSSSSCAP